MNDDNRFLSRWSQRKRQAAEEARQVPQAAQDPASEAGEPTPDEPFDLSLLPDLEALTPETDLRLFLQKGVPDHVRNAALRKMWALDPAIRHSVGDALDYAWDWNAPGGVPGGGELGAGYDAAKMVARIFGDDLPDENVIENVAVQQMGLDPVSGSDHKSIGPAPQTALVEESPAESDISEQLPAPEDSVKSHAAPQKRRRHGGAVPFG